MQEIIITTVVIGVIGLIIGIALPNVTAPVAERACKMPTEAEEL